MSQLKCHLSHIQLCICVRVIYCISIDSLFVGLERMGMNEASLKKTVESFPLKDKFSQFWISFATH